LKILITGLSGFAGKHLIEYLSLGGVHEFFGVDLERCSSSLNTGDSSLAQEKADLARRDEVDRIINRVQPDQVYHLAAQSSVRRSWEDPVGTFRSNVFSGINLLESIRAGNPGTAILVVCTAEVYGESAEGDAIKESDSIFPGNPYAVSKAAMDFMASIYYKAYGLKVTVARSFNHIGPGQSEGFVCSDFARQVALIEAGKQEPVIKVGNLDSSRDFLDVRDVAKAYWHIMNRGKPGQAYNVCSGIPVKVSSLLEMLIALSRRKDIEIKLDKDKFRPIDIPAIYGDNSRLAAETGWQPQYKLDESLSDILDWWRKMIRTGRGKKS